MAKRGLGSVPWLSDRQPGEPGSIAGAEAHARAFDAVVNGPAAARATRRTPRALCEALERLAANSEATAIVVFGRYDQVRVAVAAATDEGATPDQLRRLVCTIAFDFETATASHSCPVYVDPSAARLRGFDERLQRYRDRSGQ